jgi:hypothetical protein
MKTHSKIALCIALAAAMSPVTLAQSEDGRPGPGRRGPQGPPGIGAEGRPFQGPGGPRGGMLPPWLDTNRNGVLDADEIASVATRLAELDTDGDGYLSPDELRPGPGRGPQGDGAGRPGYGPEGRPGRGPEGPGRGFGPGPGPGMPPVPPLFVLLDTNQDGILDADEVEQAAAVLTALDTDGDGKVSMDEIRVRMMEIHGAGRPHPGSPGHGVGEGHGPGPGRGPGQGQGPGPRGPRGPQEGQGQGQGRGGPRGGGR